MFGGLNKKRTSGMSLNKRHGWRPLGGSSPDTDGGVLARRSVLILLGSERSKQEAQLPMPGDGDRQEL